jgi:hypothetical protein
VITNKESKTSAKPRVFPGPPLALAPSGKDRELGLAALTIDK